MYTAKLNLPQHVIKNLKILVLAAIFVLISSGSAAQVSDSIYYNRLYWVCKAWGHVKYYHTETANGNVNWDDVLIKAVNGIKNAPDNDSFNDSLLAMLNSAGEMEIRSGTLPDIPDSLNNNSDLSWIRDPIFAEPVKALLDTIRSKFRPQNNVYVDEAWAGGNPTFAEDNLYYAGSYYPDESKRILALFRYWNIINYFYPYKNIMDQNWDTTLVEFIPQIVEATDSLSYCLTFKRLTNMLNDSHTSFYNSPIYTKWTGKNYPPFLARFIENETVITKVLSQITEVGIGDIIKEIDGVNIYELRDSLRVYAAGSNNAHIEGQINDLILRGASGSFSLTVDNGTTLYTVSLNRNSTNFDQLNTETGPIWKDTVLNETCTFGIVDMGRLGISHLSTMFSDLWDTDAIVFDIRNYPNGTLWNIVNYLFPSAIHIANFTVPDIRYPGRLTWLYEHIGSGTINPYSGNILLLFDERTLSQAEYTCMGLEQFPGAIKIGSSTAAADGNVTTIYLPGYISTNATFLGTYYPDFTATQRVGILPDFEVHPTISGIRAGKDELMDFALNCDFVGIKGGNTVEDLKIYPNPVIDELVIETRATNPIEVLTVTDCLGRMAYSENFNPSSRARIEQLGFLPPGLYFVIVKTKEGILTGKIIKK